MIEPNERSILEFETTEGKTLLVAIDTTNKYIICRYGSNSTLELEFPGERRASWDEIQYSWYLRGGGTENEAMDLNYLYFDFSNSLYVVFQEYVANEGEPKFGLTIKNQQNLENRTIRALPQSIIGSLTELRDNPKIQIGEELFR
jgi:hypothetical protein